MPQPKTRKKTAARKAQQATVERETAEAKKLTPEQYMRRRIWGWALVALGVAVAVSHWLAHLGVLYEDRPLYDLLIGYPMGGLLGITGAIVLSR